MLPILKIKRLERGLSQYALYLLSGVPQARICYAEKGFPSLNEKHKKALANSLGCTVDELFPPTEERRMRTN